MLTLADLLANKAKGTITVPETASVGEAIRTMCRRQVGAVIIPSTEGVPIGIFTERDVMRLYSDGRGDFEALTVRECMTPRPSLGSPEDRVDDALATMTEKRFRHLPVVQDGQVVGVISIGDLVKAKLEETAGEAQALRQYIHS